MTNLATCETPEPRILLDDAAFGEAPPELETRASRAATDLQHVEELLDRCWRELDGVDLNVKLTDVIRLLEFKHKLGPGSQAERTFWDLIDQIRHDELAHYGDIPGNDES